MKKYVYKKIDAFTSGASLGNPAACIYLSGDEVLTDEEMLAIAKQHKGFVSEMVYCSMTQGTDIKLIYYSSECEVDFCGHGTIACLYELIKNNPDLRTKTEIEIKTRRKGLLTVFNDLDTEDAVYITAPEPKYLANSLTYEAMASALEIAQENLSRKYPIELINAGLATFIVPIEALDSLIHIYPDESALKKFCELNHADVLLIFSTEVSNQDHIAHTRVFAPKFGYLEDPATGSANSAFGYYMLKHGLWDGHAVSLEQGGYDQIFNTVRMKTHEGVVLFGGRVTTRMEGCYFL